MKNLNEATLASFLCRLKIGEKVEISVCLKMEGILLSQKRNRNVESGIDQG